MKKLVKITSACTAMAMMIVLFFPGSLVSAQSPSLMSYQAIVRKPDGSIVKSGTIALQISILKGSASGIEIFKESHSTVPNTNGLVTVAIGSGTPQTGEISSIDWSTGPYFIKIEIDPDGGTSYSITSVTQLLTVPYAFHATTAGSLAGGINETDPVWTATSANYYTKTNLQTSGSSLVNFTNLTNIPATLSGYGISDAVTLTTAQTISGLKTFTVDQVINGVNAGQGAGNIADNTVFGSNSLIANTGGGNTALGYQSLAANTTGSQNTSTGSYAMQYNTTGYYNTAVGSSSLKQNTTGNNNTSFGFQSILSNTTGSINSAFGATALLSNTTGQYNTAIGSGSLYNETTGTGNTALGMLALNACISSNYNTAIGFNAGNNITLGSNNTAIGNVAVVPNAIGSNQVRIGNSAVTYAGIQVAWTITSDRSLKSDIETSALGLAFIRNLKPVSYLRKSDSSQRIEYGFIAQDVDETLRNMGQKNSGLVAKDDEGVYSLRYNDLMAPMVKAIQEQQQQIEKQQQEIAELKALLKESISARE